jgi:hypothetical protein
MLSAPTRLSGPEDRVGLGGVAEHKKAIVREEYGSPDVLELRDIAKPEIEDNEVLVHVHAAGVDSVWLHPDPDLRDKKRAAIA